MTDLFINLFSRVPFDIKFKLFNCMQDPKYHPEGSVFEHIKYVAQNLPDTIDFQLASIFHDLGKLDTTKAIEKEDCIRIQSIGHETWVNYYILRLKYLYETFDPNWERISNICENHMRAHLFRNEQITRPIKVERFKSNVYYNDIMLFEETDRKHYEGKAKPIIIFTMGIPGSGKSYWSKRFYQTSGYELISSDDMRKEMTGNISDISLDGEVWKALENKLISNIKDNKNTIFDSTMCNVKTVNKFIRIASGNIIVFKIFEIDKEEAKKRIKEDIINKVDRSNVPDFIVDRMHTNFSLSLNNLYNLTEQKLIFMIK